MSGPFLPSSGDVDVGKTSLIARLTEGQFKTSMISTVGLEFSTKTLRVGEEWVVFQLWDTAGQERWVWWGVVSVVDQRLRQGWEKMVYEQIPNRQMLFEFPIFVLFKFSNSGIVL